VGRTLVARLVSLGYGVWGADRIPTTGGFAGERELTVELKDPQAVGDMLEDAAPEGIFHLAAQASVRRSFEQPIDTILDNTVPILYLLDHMKSAPTACRLLVVGSADEYGTVADPDRLPLDEKSPVHPNNPYALAKSIQNQYCLGFAALYGLDVVLTRSFNHTGPGQADTYVLPSFARQVAEIKLGLREPVIEVGNLEIKRDFLDVRDVCSAYIALMEHGTKGEVYNVCTGGSYVLRDLLERMCRLAGVDVEIVVDPNRLRPADTPELRGVADKIRTDTGWKPEYSIEDTLGELIRHWETVLQDKN
jgi:GDP-4-dehydro-6-deoxy-D-mannose reductase